MTTSRFNPVSNKWEHSFRQSWISEADLCSERARAEHAYPKQRRETDAACIGTACHAVFENALLYDTSVEDGVAIFHHEFDILTQQKNFHWIKYTPKAAHKFGEHCVRLWFHHVLPGCDRNAKVEWSFKVPLVEDDTRVIRLTGTADYLVREGLRDWKTNGGREYEEWEKRRWAIQPTIYTYAAHHEGLVDTDEDGNVPFEFVVVGKQGVQYVPVVRGPGDWAWLRRKATALAVLIEGELSTWPLNDNHALCSPDWCPNWARCKGADLGLGRPQNWDAQ